MNYYLALLGLILLLLLLYALFALWRRWRRRRLWRRLEKTPLSEAMRRHLETIPHYHLLPPEMKEAIQPKMLYFVQDKEFRGIGITITDEIRTVIAFYACLLVLKIPDECFGILRTILIYPSEIVTKQVEEAGGIHREEETILEGQSSGDTVVIVWHDARHQALHPGHQNVILHELAHVLDFEDGAADGTPPLPLSRYSSWSSVLYRRYRALREKSQTNRDWGSYRLLGEYAATNEAEFFAVATELFFTRPRSMRRHFRDLYDEFKSFYRLDTADLFGELEHSKEP